MVGYRSASGGQGHGLVQQGAAGEAADADLGRAAGVLGVERLVGLDLHADFRGQVAVHRRGVDDAAAAVDAVAGDLRLGVTEGGDAFLPLGEDAEDPTLPGELCYRDDEGAVCRCWNWRDGQRTALTDDSANAILVVECVDPARRADLEAALDEFAALMERYLGASIEVRAVVDRAHPEVVLAG